jgi:Effector-associated domain 5
MPLIDQDDLRALHQAIIDGGLASDAELGALLEGLSPGYVATLPDRGAPAARLLRVLGRLNREQPLRDGTVPLRVLLENAVHLAAGRQGGNVFEDLLRRLESPAASGDRASPLRLLFLSAQPESEGTLNPGRAYRAIEEAIAQAGGRDRIHLASGWAVRPTDLLPHLDQHRPHLVHLHAHGSVRGMLFEWEDERTVIVRPEAMRILLRSAGGAVRLVFFGGCHSASLAESVASEVDFAVGMRGSVEEKAETRFAAAFYGAISMGRSVQSAFEQALAVTHALGLGEQDTPGLWTRRGRDAASTVLLEKGDRSGLPRT